VTGPDAVHVTTVVELQVAFEILTAELDAWWKSGPRYRVDPERRSFMRLDGLVGEAFTGMLGSGWADLLVGLRSRAVRARG
jgi:hypothetical protein